jgi:hypothetical protein
VQKRLKIGLALMCAACRFNYDLDPEYDPSQRGGSLGGAGRSGNAGHTAHGGNVNDAGGPAQAGATAGFSGSAGQSAGGSSGSAGAAPNSAGAAGASGTGGALDCTSSATCQCASYDNKTYRFCTTPQFNSVAQTDCVANAMTLARIDDASENEWLFIEYRCELWLIDLGSNSARHVLDWCHRRSARRHLDLAG